MSRNVIELEAVSKRYRLGERSTHSTLRDAIAASVRRAVRFRPAPEDEDLWSLRDVSLAVEDGAALGIVGRNGAGKSTLLKIITRITEPTSGVSRTRGSVGSLLEVGTGFHPELTGRENVYLNGAILGMKRREIDRRFDEIADFAGVHRFLDTPVKRYSSGMYLRLAFSVAAHLDAEIMAIDEVLAVGDAEFQARCLGKMGALERDGRTVVFVSHDVEAIARLCRNAVWLEFGVVKAHGPTRGVIDAYLAAGAELVGRRTFPDRPDRTASLRSVSLTDESGRLGAIVDRDHAFAVELRFVIQEPIRGLDVTVFVENLYGVRVLDEAWSEHGGGGRGMAGEYVARVVVPPVLAVGEYVAGVWVGSAYETLVYEEQALRFRLEGSHRGRPDRIVQLSPPADARWLIDGPVESSNHGHAANGSSPRRAFD